MSKNMNYASAVKRHISDTINDTVFYGKRYQLDEPVVTPYPFEQDDWQKSVEEISKKIKSYDSCLAGCNLKFENNSFELENQEVTPSEKMENLKAKSSNGKVVMKFVTTDFEKKIKDEVTRQTAEMRNELIGIKKMTIYPILNRQLRRSTKEKMFYELEAVKDFDNHYAPRGFDNNCTFLNEIIKKRTNNEKMSKLETQILDTLTTNWSLKELKELFFNQYLTNELNTAAHPNLNNPFFKELVNLDSFYKKMYDYVLNVSI